MPPWSPRHTARVTCFALPAALPLPPLPLPWLPLLLPLPLLPWLLLAAR
jgi:hypothetical protein